MKKLLIIIAIIALAVPCMAKSGTNYVLMGLTVVDGGENPDYYELINGATNINIQTIHGIVVGEAGVNKCVLFPLAALKTYAPESWSELDMANWLSEADGFLAFDWRMLGVYASIPAMTITNRAYTYEQARDLVYNYEWWTEVDDEWVKDSGKKADYLARGGGTKLVRVVPMPKFLGVNE